MALSSGEQGSSDRAAVSHRRASARSSAAVSAMPEPGAAGPGSSRSCQDQCGHLKCQWRSSGEPRCAHLWHPPLGGESTGIHSPCLVCHCSTPPTSLNFTLRHVNADPCSFHASSSVVYWLDSELDFPCVPAYLRACAAWDWDTQSQTLHASCSPGSTAASVAWPPNPLGRGISPTSPALRRTYALMLDSMSLIHCANWGFSRARFTSGTLSGGGRGPSFTATRASCSLRS